MPNAGFCERPAEGLNLSKPEVSRLLLFKSLIGVSGKNIIKLGFIEFVAMSLEITQPLLFQAFLAALDDDTQSILHTVISALTLCCVELCSTVLRMSVEWYFRGEIRAKTKNCLQPLVYTCTLSQASHVRGQYTSGELVQHITVDCNKITDGLMSLHRVFASPFWLIGNMAMLFMLIGPSAVSGVGVLALFVPLNSLLSHLLSKMEKKLSSLRDKRSQLINEFIAAIRAVKLQVWESKAEQDIMNARNTEMRMKFRMGLFRAFLEFFFRNVSSCVTLLVFMTYVHSGKSLSAAVAFPALSLLGRVGHTLSGIPFLITTFVETHVSLGRLAKFLSHDSVDAYCKPTKSREEYDVIIHNAVSTWKDCTLEKARTDDNTHDGYCGICKASPDTLCEEESGTDRSAPFKLTVNSLFVIRGELVMVVGDVGCGKSSLLAMVCNEMSRVRGTIWATDSCSFCPQEPFVMNASIRDNILMGDSIDSEFYQKVLATTCLDKDLLSFEAGDATEIGEGGVTLSGGQKARLALARAVYRRPKLILLDNPLAAVDASTGHKIMENCICGLLKGTTSIVMVTHAVEHMHKADTLIVLSEGAVAFTGPPSQLQTRDNVLSSWLSQVLQTSPATTAANPTQTATTKTQINNAQKVDIVEEERCQEGAVSKDVILYYWRAFGGILPAVVLVVLISAERIVSIGEELVIAIWTHATEEIRFPPEETNLFYIKVYAAFVGGGALLVFLGTLMTSIAGMRASQRMFRQLLVRVASAPLPCFFDITPQGRIRNRFVEDIERVDSEVPWVKSEFLRSIVSVISYCLLIAFTTVQTLPTPWLLVVILPIAIINYRALKQFRPLGRDLRRISKKASSFVQSHFSESTAGLETIRAFGLQRQFLDKAYRLIDDTQVCDLVNRCNHLWLMFRIHGSSILLAGFLKLIFAYFKDKVTGSTVGLFFVCVRDLTGNAHHLLNMLTEFEQSMISVERIKEYSTMPGERTDGKAPKQPWPTDGTVRFEGASMRYRPDCPLSLRNVSVTIPGGAKVGVVGRTGSGKSTLLSTLFRVADIEAGSIQIDGVDIATLPLSLLRSSIGIVPQDPTLFIGTVQSNIDPFNEYGDDRVKRVLQKVCLNNLRLDTEVVEGGLNLSVGERQLVCLARAMLRSCRIIVLDEATQALDSDTEKAVTTALENSFEGTTTITIAHRLSTIIQSDIIIVMDAGTVKETGSPADLLLDQQTAFSQLVQSTGQSEANRLRLLAMATKCTNPPTDTAVNWHQ